MTPDEQTVERVAKALWALNCEEYTYDEAKKGAANGEQKHANAVEYIHELAEAAIIAMKEAGMDRLVAEGQQCDAIAIAIARNDALREAAHECEQVAYSGKYPQDDQSELGCLRCRDNVLAMIEGDTND